MAVKPLGVKVDTKTTISRIYTAVITEEMIIERFNLPPGSTVLAETPEKTMFLGDFEDGGLTVTWTRSEITQDIGYWSDPLDITEDTK